MMKEFNVAVVFMSGVEIHHLCKSSNPEAIREQMLELYGYGKVCYVTVKEILPVISKEEVEDIKAELAANKLKGNK